ncbi:MAG: NAD-dependent epimerase/dehydratase family protein, partial [Actinomycetota bacterium]
MLITGGNGFLGRNVVEAFKSAGAEVVAPTHKQADLTQPGVALALFKKHKPSHVVHLAARVGGIGYNQVAPAPLYFDNLMMGTHTIEADSEANDEKTILLGTVCSYPKFTPVPFREESIWDGYP